MNHRKSLQEIHEEVPAEHYDLGIQNNLFQKIWHKLRFSEVTRNLDQRGGRWLDIGCHSGLFTEQIIKKVQPGEVYGIDISKDAISFAKKRIKQGNFICGDAEDLPFKNNFFDLVICLEMLEHVDHPDKVIKEMYRVMKKSGNGLILVPSDSKLFKFIWAIWTSYYPVWKHAHVQSFSNSRLEKMLREVGFKIILSKNFNFGMLKLVKFIKL